MLLVVGLGNPGKKYAGNRHNVGFVVVDELARAMPDFREKFSGVFTRGSLAGEDVVVLKPLTFMNVSGDSVQPASAFHKIGVREVVVVHDELDLPFGEVRVKVGGGHAGHNGLRSIIDRMGSPDFTRVRVGVGRPPPGFRGDVADYVLSDFDAIERASLPDVVKRAVEAVSRVAELGPQAAMNQVNGPKPAPKPPKPAKAPKPAGAPAPPAPPAPPAREEPEGGGGGREP
ncbi:MAG: aminoacyl-tRNA hydrolase [Myxococcales bacterium]|jgi:PTH1 family peptidyl-tRNA hydrolase|nr:aminoacyl-tRNA hydrolase [Myxococcales bacterium]